MSKVRLRNRLYQWETYDGITELVVQDENGAPTSFNLTTGNMAITSTAQVNVRNYATAQVADNDLIPENIKNGINILGITGTYGGGITPTGNINITNTQQTDVTNYATAQIVDANLVSSNIKSGITILGISGNTNVVDTSDANATADKILSTYSGYVQGSKVNGTIQTYDGSSEVITS